VRVSRPPPSARPPALIDSVFFLSGGHFQLDLAMSGSPTCSRRRLTWLDLIERARASPLGGGYLLMYLLPLCDKLFQDTMPIAAQCIKRERQSDSGVFCWLRAVIYGSIGF
jgi:hypothetical protein